MVAMLAFVAFAVSPAISVYCATPSSVREAIPLFMSYAADTKSALVVPAQVLEKFCAAFSSISSSVTPSEDSSAIAFFVSKLAVTGDTSACASCAPTPVSIVPVFIMSPYMPFAGEVMLSIRFRITLSLKIDSNPITPPLFPFFPHPGLHYVFPDFLHIPCLCEIVPESIHIYCLQVKIL